MNAKKINLFYLCALLLFAALMWSFLSHRPMFQEGGQWYTFVLQWETVFTDMRMHRYFDYVIQAPAVFFLKAFRDYSYETVKLVAIYILSFNWTMHIMVSLIASFFILHKKGRADLIVFQLISVLGCYMQASSYAVALAMPAMSCFWPLFYFYIFADGFKKSDYLLYLLLGFLLAICYEVTVIFFAFFSAIALLDIFVLKKRKILFNIYVIIVSSVFSAVLIKTILTIPSKITGPFISSLLTDFDNYRIFGLCIAALTLPLPFMAGVKPAFRKPLLAVLVVLFCAAVFYFGNLVYLTYMDVRYPRFTPFGLFQAYAARSTALPLTGVIAFLCYVFNFRKAGSEWLASPSGKILSLFLLIFTFMIASIDVLLTNEWRRDYRKIEQITLNNTGCLNIEASEYEKLDLSPKIDSYCVPYTSIIIQLLHQVNPVKTLIFSNVPLGGTELSSRNACLEVKDGHYTNNQGFDVRTREGSIKFSEELSRR